MPSSTSSSDARLPGGRSRRILAAGLTLVLAMSAAYELVLRARGFLPSINDDVQLWSLTRSEVGRDDSDEVVLIGASRSQADIDGPSFASLFNGRKPRQLAIAGASPIPVLDDLARDESFKGLVICDVMPIYFFTGLQWQTGIGAEYVAYARNERPWDRAATRLRLVLQSHLALRAPDVTPSPGFLLQLLGLRPLARQHTRVDANRYTHIDRRPEEVSRETIVSLARETGETQPVGQERLDHDLELLNAAVRRIQHRGGRVVFTVLPVSGLRREAEERRFPRAEFWDKFASRIDAPTIHFADYAELSGFVCHDGSHLTIREAPAFTRSFVPILKAKIGPAVAARASPAAAAH